VPWRQLPNTHGLVRAHSLMAEMKRLRLARSGIYWRATAGSKRSSGLQSLFSTKLPRRYPALFTPHGSSSLPRHVARWLFVSNTTTLAPISFCVLLFVIGVAAVNAVAIETTLEVSSKIFEVMGASSSLTKHGYDRFFRNIRGMWELETSRVLQLLTLNDSSPFTP
jgi:hypothetical protein